MSDLEFLAGRVQQMAGDGHGYYAQEDIARLIKVADAMYAANAEITALRSSLSTARSEGVREGLEMGARVASERFTRDSVVKNKNGEPYITGSAAIYASGQIATAIRAKIEEVKP